MDIDIFILDIDLSNIVKKMDIKSKRLLSEYNILTISKKQIEKVFLEKR